MAKGKTVRIRQELVQEVRREVEKGKYQSLSEFVSDAIRLRLQQAAKERVSEYLKQDAQNRILQTRGSLFFTLKHVWIKLTPQGTATLGVSDFFESWLRGIVYIGGFKEGDNVTKDQPFGTIETAFEWPLNGTHDLYSPINGKIVKVNQAVLGDPFILNGNPYQWIVEVQPHSPQFRTELDNLLSFEDYTQNITHTRGQSIL
ncbi:MAG: hypothetical protein JSV35_04875 [Candidatus Bathyarchaeota archaeon]|nr:MAG: hypothetical protein JSV35_04875 [Candidatus Bathyarchaeota archaeon]